MIKNQKMNAAPAKIAVHMKMRATAPSFWS